MSERHVTFDMILQAVSATAGKPVLVLLSDIRTDEVAQARWAAWWIARELTTLSSATLGRLTGLRDRTTVEHGIERAAALRETNPAFLLATDTILATLRALERRGLLVFAASSDPLQAARRVLAAPEREAARVSIYEIIGMSRLVVEFFGAGDAPTPSPPHLEIDHES
ncbi:MAG: hypothetical protein DI527_07530 [Chelatococcus sp.]|nr:MAG: hypothetical protein DI527_07530 [Chelatococcus sp.]